MFMRSCIMYTISISSYYMLTIYLSSSLQYPFYYHRKFPMTTRQPKPNLCTIERPTLTSSSLRHSSRVGRHWYLSIKTCSMSSVNEHHPPFNAHPTTCDLTQTTLTNSTDSSRTAPSWPSTTSCNNEAPRLSWSPDPAEPPPPAD